jgi:hypothetical protein
MKDMQERHIKEANELQNQLMNYDVDKIKMGNLEHKLSEIGSGLEDILR